jgi:DNA-binding transcriptional LysR family regulator
MRNGSLTAAAEAVNVSQPAVSKLLRHFESQIGYRLFERIGSRLVATPEAHLLYRDADRIFREIETLKAFSNRIRDKRLGLLRVGASAPPTFALLPRAIERFRRRNPGIAIELHTLSAEDIAERIVIGEIDLGVTMATIAEPRVRSDVLGRTEVVAVVPNDSRLAARGEVTPQDFVDETLISYGSKPRVGQMLDRAFMECGLSRKPAIEVTLSIAALPLLLRRAGIALVDGLVPWASFGAFAVRPFRPRVSLDIVLSTNPTLPQTRFTREFTRDLRAAIGDLGR